MLFCSMMHGTSLPNKDKPLDFSWHYNVNLSQNYYRRAENLYHRSLSERDATSLKTLKEASYLCILAQAECEYIIRCYGKGVLGAKIDAYNDTLDNHRKKLNRLHYKILNSMQERKRSWMHYLESFLPKEKK